MRSIVRRVEDALVARLPVSRSLLRFAAVGASGVVVNQVVLALLVGAGLVVPLASVLASETAVVNNYVWDERWTFGRGRLTLRRLLKFNATALVGIAITAGVVTLLTATTDLPVLVANLPAVAAATAWNYLVSSRWVFQRDAGTELEADPTPAATPELGAAPE